MNVKFSNGNSVPLDMHKVRIIQRTELVPIDQRMEAIESAGFNTFLLRSKDIFLDMLTDSGTNAMSDNQLGAMMVSDDAYAGSESFYKLQDAIKDVFGFEFVLPVHQGRAAEHLLSRYFIKEGNVIPMNYHFTTSKAHFEIVGGKILEICTDEALKTESDHPFKGNLDLDKFEEVIKEEGADNIAFVRMEATTNLIGGQPFSIENLRGVKQIAEKHNIPVVIDGSLISENAYLIQKREEEFKKKGIKEIIREIMSLCDVLYLSGRKSCSVRGGFIATNDSKVFNEILPLLPLYEGFLTYGGMSSKEIEAMAVGIREMTDSNVAGSSVEMIRYFVERLQSCNVPVVTPAGGLACHVDAVRFVSHLNSFDYPAGALAAAIFIVSGIRSMERGTISMERDEEGNEVASDLELARLAIPRRVYSIAHIEYAVDRLHWLFQNKKLIGGLTFIEEPPVLRFFFGRLNAKENWHNKLADAFKADFGSDN